MPLIFSSPPLRLIFHFDSSLRHAAICAEAGAKRVRRSSACADFSSFSSSCFDIIDYFHYFFTFHFARLYYYYLIFLHYYYFRCAIITIFLRHYDAIIISLLLIIMLLFHLIIIFHFIFRIDIIYYYFFSLLLPFHASMTLTFRRCRHVISLSFFIFAAAAGGTAGGEARGAHDLLMHTIIMSIYVIHQPVACYQLRRDVVRAMSCWCDSTLPVVRLPRCLLLPVLAPAADTRRH